MRPLARAMILVAMSLATLAWVGCKRTKGVPAGDDAGAARIPLRADDPCLVNCELRAKELGCRQPAGCQNACIQLRDAKFCGAQLRDFTKCFLAQPKDQWQCDGDGIPAVKEDACEAERGNVMDCLHTHDGQL